MLSPESTILKTGNSKKIKYIVETVSDDVFENIVIKGIMEIIPI